MKKIAWMHKKAWTPKKSHKSNQRHPSVSRALQHMLLHLFYIMENEKAEGEKTGNTLGVYQILHILLEIGALKRR